MCQPLLLLRRLAADRIGVTAMKYGLIAGVLSVGIISAMTVMRDKITAAIGAITF